MGYETSGRSGQKRRTRQALVDATRKLIARDGTVTVDAAAQAAGVSRATAYRYFPTQRELLIAAHPETQITSMLSPDAPDDPVARLAEVVKAFTTLIIDTEQQQRTMLRLSLDTDHAATNDLPLRKGRAIGWIAEALTSTADRLTPAQIDRLVLAIRSAVGIEALVWLTDVARLPPADAAELMRWSAQALLHAALTQVPPPT